MLALSIIFFIIALIVAAFFAMSETAILSMNRFKLEHLESTGNRTAGRLKQLRMKPDRFLATVLVGNTFVNAAAASLATFVFGLAIGTTEEAIVLATVTVTLFLLVFSEITPKTYASHHPERMGFILYRLIQAAMWLLTPIVLVVTWLSRGFLRLLGLEPAPIHDRLSEDEFRSILNVGAEEGAIAQTKRKMLSSIFDIAKKSVKEVMIPRTMMIMIEESTPPGKVFEIFVHSGFSRIPVFSGHAENVVGTIHAKDLLGLLQRGEEADIGRLLRKPFFIPASAPVETALSEFQKAKVHMGIVVDEYGGLEGIVTIEDLIEEIVGEIQDEHDEESDYLRPQPDGSCLIDGGAAIDKINERLSLGIPEEPGFMTIAGFILSKLGRIPKETEAIEFNGRQFIVEKVTRRTISLIRLVPVASPPCTQLKKNGMPTNEGDH